MRKYMSTKEAAQRWGVSERRVADLCVRKVVEAKKEKGTWSIPEDVKKPADKRVKSGAYKKETPSESAPACRRV